MVIGLFAAPSCVSIYNPDYQNLGDITGTDGREGLVSARSGGATPMGGVMPRYRYRDEEPSNEEFPNRTHWREYSGPAELREMNDIHGDLAGYDSGMAGLLARVWGGERIRPRELRPDPELRARLRRIMAEGSPAASKDAAKYLEYLDGLEREVERAREHVLGTKG